MNNKAKLSIVMPTFNRAKVIERAIKSILRSDRNDIELIVSDDGSTDETISIINSIYDNRLILIENETNKNANFARNQGIKKANGDIIAFIDSDDEFLENRIDNILFFFKNNKDIDVLIGSFLVYKNNKEIEDIDFIEGSVSNKNLSNYLVSHAIPITFSTIVATKNSLELIGLLDDNFWRHQDRDYLLTAIKNKHKFYIKNGKDVIKHQEEDSFSRSYKGYINGLDKIVCKHGIFKEDKYDIVLSYFISRVFIKSIFTFNITSLRYNLNAFKNSKCINGNILLHISKYIHGKKQRKYFKQKFQGGVY